VHSLSGIWIVVVGKKLTKETGGSPSVFFCLLNFSPKVKEKKSLQSCLNKGVAGIFVFPGFFAG